MTETQHTSFLGALAGLSGPRLFGPPSADLLRVVREAVRGPQVAAQPPAPAPTPAPATATSQTAPVPARAAPPIAAARSPAMPSPAVIRATVGASQVRPLVDWDAIASKINADGKRASTGFVLPAEHAALRGGMSLPPAGPGASAVAARASDDLWGEAAAKLNATGRQMAGFCVPGQMGAGVSLGGEVK